MEVIKGCASKFTHSWTHTFDLEPMLESSLLADCRPLGPVAGDGLAEESVVLYRMYCENPLFFVQISI